MMEDLGHDSSSAKPRFRNSRIMRFSARLSFL